MRRTMSIWVLLGAAACLLVVFFVYSSELQKNSVELKEVYEQSKTRLTALRNEQSDLKSMLDAAGTDEFVENQARTLYGYMMPEEIRFVISNPEALYGDGKAPSR